MQDMFQYAKIFTTVFVELYRNKDALVKETGEAIKEIGDIFALAKKIAAEIIAGKEGEKK